MSESKNLLRFPAGGGGEALAENGRGVIEEPIERIVFFASHIMGYKLSARTSGRDWDETESAFRTPPLPVKRDGQKKFLVLGVDQTEYSDLGFYKRPFFEIYNQRPLGINDKPEKKTGFTPAALEVSEEKREELASAIGLFEQAAWRLSPKEAMAMNFPKAFVGELIERQNRALRFIQGSRRHFASWVSRKYA